MSVMLGLPGTILFEPRLPNLELRRQCNVVTRGRIEQEELPQSLPGQFYEGPSSIPRRVPVGRECDPHQAFSKVQIPLIAPPH